MGITTAVMPSDEKGNDAADHIHDKNYMQKIEYEPTPLEKLQKLSATNRIPEIEENLKNDMYIFPDLALSGQITLFYARPNTGKTIFFLRFLQDAIKDKRIDGKNVFYVNADDSYDGLYTKAKLAEQYGFNMVSPAEAGVAPQAILQLLENIAEAGQADGIVILLDTLKKFADMISKQSQANLYEVLRRVIAKGGTVIIAGHTNKHNDADGNLVYEGTSDTMNDVDCAYSMYRMSPADDEIQIVEFRREKDRGKVIAKVSYQYKKSADISYREMLESVERLEKDEALQISTQARHNIIKEKYEAEMLFVSSQLKISGKMNQSALIAALKADPDLSHEITARSLKTALKKLTDVVWTAERGDKNAMIYALIGSEANLYRQNSKGGY